MHERDQCACACDARLHKNVWCVHAVAPSKLEHIVTRSSAEYFNDLRAERAEVDFLTTVSYEQHLTTACTSISGDERVLARLVWRCWCGCLDLLFESAERTLELLIITCRERPPYETQVLRGFRSQSFAIAISRLGIGFS